MRCRHLSLILLVTIAACNGTSVIPIPDAGSDTVPDIADTEVSSGDSMAPDVDTDHPSETVCEDCGADVTSCEGTGCFGEPCVENADCDSGFCVDHMGDRVCTQECIEDCPEGWICSQVGGGPDVMFICISPFRVLCRPCVDASDCTSASGYEDSCIDYGEEGLFCGAACGDAPCPEGYACQEMPDAMGALSDQCVPTTGTCECSDTSVAPGPLHALRARQRVRDLPRPADLRRGRPLGL
ncbi:MAG: hypothetical protein ABIK09_04485 [Pseudomonadota bacterium]